MRVRSDRAAGWISQLLTLLACFPPRHLTFHLLSRASLAQLLAHSCCTNVAHLLPHPPHAPSSATPQQTSPSDFWSKRWNLPASYTLRALVFDPIMEGKAIPEEPVPPPPPYPAAPTLLSSAPHGPITPPGAPSSVQQAPAAHEGVAAGMLGQAAPLLAGGEGELAPSTTSSPVGYVLVGREQDQSIPPAREHSAGK